VGVGVGVEFFTLSAKAVLEDALLTVQRGSLCPSAKKSICGVWLESSRPLSSWESFRT
jgi:hypothetical protein